MIPMHSFTKIFTGGTILEERLMPGKISYLISLAINNETKSILITERKNPAATAAQRQTQQQSRRRRRQSQRPFRRHHATLVFAARSSRVDDE